MAASTAWLGIWHDVYCDRVYAAKGGPAEGGYATAAYLAQFGVDAIDKAVNDAGESGLQKLIAQLEAEFNPPRIPYRQGIWHRRACVGRRWPVDHAHGFVRQGGAHAWLPRLIAEQLW